MRLPDLLADLFQLVLDERARRPIGHRLADVEEKVRDHLTAARRVCHFGVEQHAEDRARLMTHRRDRDRVAARRNDIPWWRTVHVVAVAHPGREALRELESLEQPIGLGHLYFGAPILPFARADHLAALEMRD